MCKKTRRSYKPLTPRQGPRNHISREAEVVNGLLQLQNRCDGRRQKLADTGDLLRRHIQRRSPSPSPYLPLNLQQDSSIRTKSPRLTQYSDGDETSNTSSQPWYPQSSAHSGPPLLHQALTGSVQHPRQSSVTVIHAGTGTNSHSGWVHSGSNRGASSGVLISHANNNSNNTPLNLQVTKSNAGPAVSSAPFSGQAAYSIISLVQMVDPAAQQQPQQQVRTVQENYTGIRSTPLYYLIPSKNLLEPPTTVGSSAARGGGNGKNGTSEEPTHESLINIDLARLLLPLNDPQVSPSANSHGSTAVLHVKCKMGPAFL